MKPIAVNGLTYNVGELTLRQIITLQKAFARWQRLGGVDIKSLSPEDATMFAEVAAVLVGVGVETALDWPFAHTIQVIVRAGQAFTEINGPYLTQQVAPALEGLTKFATAMTAALAPKAA